MHEGAREITGFACRWCVLALAGAVVIAGSWTGLAGAGSAPTAPGAGVVAVDRLCQQSGRKAIQVMLHHVDSPAVRGATHVFVALPDGSQIKEGARRQDISWAWIPRGRPERVDVQVVGLPYGPLAFRRAAATVVIVPKGPMRFVVDARAPLAARGKEAANWRDCLVRLERRGPVAFLFVGPVGDYADARDKLQELLPGAAVEYAEPDDLAVCRSLRGIAHALNPERDKAKPHPSFVTSRRGLAVLTRRYKYPTHLVDRADPQIDDASLKRSAKNIKAGAAGSGARR